MTWLGRATWGLAGATLALYLLIVLWSLPLIMAAAGGLIPFDLRPLGYDLDAAQEFLTALSEAGRNQYLGPQHLLDGVFPPLLSITLGLTFWQLFSRRWAMVLIVLAAVGGWLDLQENMAVADLLKLGPQGVDEEVTSIAAVFTILKSACSGVAMMAALFGLARKYWRRG